MTPQRDASRTASRQFHDASPVALTARVAVQPDAAIRQAHATSGATRSPFTQILAARCRPSWAAPATIYPGAFSGVGRSRVQTTAARSPQPDRPACLSRSDAHRGRAPRSKREFHPPRSHGGLVPLRLAISIVGRKQLVEPRPGRHPSATTSFRPSTSVGCIVICVPHRASAPRKPVNAAFRPDRAERAATPTLRTPLPGDLAAACERWIHPHANGGDGILHSTRAAVRRRFVGSASSRGHTALVIATTLCVRWHSRPPPASTTQQLETSALSAQQSQRSASPLPAAAAAAAPRLMAQSMRHGAPTTAPASVYAARRHGREPGCLYPVAYAAHRGRAAAMRPWLLRMCASGLLARNEACTEF